MLSALVVMLLSQKTVPESRAVSVLVSRRSSWWQRSQATDVLFEARHRFSEDEVAALHKAALSLPRAAGPKCKGADKCQVVIDECLSPLGFILSAVESSEAAPDFVDVATLVLDEATDTRVMPIARRVLANTKHARAEDEARRLIVSTDYSCVGEGARMMSALPSLSVESKAAVELAFAQSAIDGLALGALVAQRPEPWAEQLFAKLFGQASTDLRLGAVRGAEERFQSSEQTRTTLAFTARCDPSARVQKEARALFTNAKLSLPAVPCPATPWSVDGKVVKGPGVEVMLTNSSNVPLPVSDCVDASKRDAKALGMVDKVCVMGVDMGEFGGELFLWRGRKRESLSGHDGFLNPVALLARGADVLVVSSVAHMSGSGALARITRNGGATFKYERLLHFSGLPTGWAVSGERVFISFRADQFVSPCPGRTEDVTYVLEPDGSFALARGAATACLWQH